MDRTLSTEEERSLQTLDQGRAAGSHRPLRSRSQCSHSLLIDGVLVPAEALINGTLGRGRTAAIGQPAR
jgi:hypothetical protein